MVITISPEGAFTWTAKNLNRQWINGDGPEQKERYPPYLGRLHTSFGSLRGRLLGGVFRWSELRLIERQRTELLVEELREMPMMGYPRGFLTKLFHSLGIRRVEFRLVQCAVRAAVATSM